MKVELLKQKDAPRFMPVLLLPEDQADGKALVFGAEENDEPVGSIVLLARETTAELFSIYVKPEFRRKGVGTALLSEARKDLAPTKVTVLTADFSSEYQDIGFFLEAQNFFIHPTAYDYAYSYQDADVLRRQAAAADISRVVPVVDMTPVQEEEFISMAEGSGYEHILKRRDTERSLSCGIFDDDDVRAVMICSLEENDGKKAIRIDLVEGKEEGGMGFLKLLRHFLSTLPKLYPEDTEIRFLGVNDRLEDLAIEYLGSALKERLTYYQAVGEAA